MKMKMKIAWVIYLLAALGVARADHVVSKPNFIIILLDDMGYADAGCYGSPNIATPRIDQLAQQGMRFTSFYAQEICGPSRAALMTGCYPMRVAEVGNIKNIHPVMHRKEITIAEVLKPLGYATGCFGKWDLAGHNQNHFHSDLMPNHQGFDYFFGTPSSNDRLVRLFRNEKLVDPHADMSTLTRRYTDEVLAFIDRNKTRPFFVYLPHTMPHMKLAASKPFLGKSPRGLYGDVMMELDYNIGRIVDYLDKNDLAKNTYVVLLSDNGPWLWKNKDFRDGIGPQDPGGSAGPLRSGKVSTWDGGTRVPAIWWAPGRIPAGAVCNSIATTMDLMPTFAALAGTHAPTDRKIDGKKITPLIQGHFDQADPDRVYYGYQLTELQTVRQGKWKLHLPFPEHRPWNIWAQNNKYIAEADRIHITEPMLYNLDDDIGEMHNVAAEHPDIVEHLTKLAQSAVEDIGDYQHIGSGERFFDPGPRRSESAEWLLPRYKPQAATAPRVSGRRAVLQPVGRIAGSSGKENSREMKFKSCLRR